MGRALLASLTLLDGTALVVCMFLCVEPSSFLTFEPILVEGYFFSYNDFRFSFCGYFICKIWPIAFSYITILVICGYLAKAMSPVPCHTYLPFRPRPSARRPNDPCIQ